MKSFLLTFCILAPLWITSTFILDKVVNFIIPNAKSIIIIHNDEQDSGTLPDSDNNDGEYKIFEVSYANVTDAVTGNANVTVKYIGQVDMSDNVDGAYGLVATDVIA